MYLHYINIIIRQFYRKIALRELLYLIVWQQVKWWPSGGFVKIISYLHHDNTFISGMKEYYDAPLAQGGNSHACDLRLL